MIRLILLIVCGLSPVALGQNWLRQATTRPADWFESDDGNAALKAIFAHQTPSGGWTKNYKPLDPDDVGRSPDWDGVGTFDNGATHSEMRVLARAVTLTGRADARAAFERGLDFIFASQYPGGGWPQRYPPGDVNIGYGTQITFNDNAMTMVLVLLQDIAAGSGDFAFVDPPRRARAASAFDRGIACVLRLQIQVDGVLTGWCAQYDADTLLPAKARSYELPSISGSEGSNIVMLLMSIEDPSPEVRRAVHAAVAWFDRVKLVDKRIATVDDPARPGKTKRVLVDEPGAPLLWARFYDIDTSRPFFCNRDGIKLDRYELLDQDRSMGYAWLGNWGKKVLDRYEEWSKRFPIEK
jgi:PelA/Pel-15E family pectate lyase